jgi:hypothetical protein
LELALVARGKRGRPFAAPQDDLVSCSAADDAERGVPVDATANGRGLEGV